jgi:hypothetical protein
MDTARSGGPALPAAMIYAIEHQGDSIRIKRDTKSARGEFSASLVYGTDGKAWKNSTAMGQQFATKLVFSKRP